MMRHSPLRRFVVRWLVNSLGLWISASFFSSISYGSRTSIVIIAGLVLALVNMFIKPLVVLFSLPALIFSLGLFMIVINGLMILLVSYLYKPFEVTSFGGAILAGLMIGLVNYLVTTLLEEKGNT